MKKILCLLIGMYSSSVLAVKEGAVLPKVDIASFNTGSINSESFKGKVTIINFWATWCEACKVELKEMETEFASLFKNEKFQFAFVSLDKDPNKAATWVKENLKDSKSFMKYLYKDPDFATAEKLTVDSFPMTFIISSDGKVKKIHKGFKEGGNSTKDMASLAGNMLDSLARSQTK